MSWTDDVWERPEKALQLRRSTIERRFKDPKPPTRDSHVWQKTKGRCYLCGSAMDRGFTFSVDHVIPRWLGGSNELWNLFPCCTDCNFDKAGKTLEEYRQDLVARVELCCPDRTAWLIRLGAEVKPLPVAFAFEIEATWPRPGQAGWSGRLAFKQQGRRR